jgi:hypothetical protein
MIRYLCSKSKNTRLNGRFFSVLTSSNDSSKFEAQIKLIDTFKSVLGKDKYSVKRNDSPSQALSFDMRQRQILIEEEQHSQAVTQQAAILSSLKEMGLGTSVKRVQSNLLNWYEPLRIALEKEISSIVKGQPSVDRKVMAYLCIYIV